MRVFLAGATGAIGRPLVRLLLAGGHEVTGMTRSPERADALRASGAEAVLADALDASAVTDAVAGARPDALIHQLTAIPARIDPRKVIRDFELTDRLRTEGTAHLLAAAAGAGVQRVIAQGVAFAYAPGPAGTVHREQDPLNADPPAQFRRSAAALADLERQVLGAGGTVLRYGYFYGPRTAIAPDGGIGAEVARRRMPIVGAGGGVWSFIHVEDAAAATVAALAAGRPGAFNIVDDEPAPVREWLPALAAALGAPPPRRVPALIARPLAGSYGVMTMTRAQGASNARAKDELGWAPSIASWREGFRTRLVELAGPLAARRGDRRGAPHFASSQLRPTPMSTASGGSRCSQTPTISRSISSRAASRLARAAPSNSSSSWIVSSRRVAAPTRRARGGCAPSRA